MLIRVATEADVEALFEVRTSVVQNHQSREELAEIGVTPQTVAEMMRTTSRAWVAEEDGRAVAFSMADADQGTVFAMFVRPGYEGRGLGRALMKHAEDWLFSRGWEEIWLLTGSDPGLRAVGFYHHLGWQAAGLQDDGQTKYIKRKGEEDEMTDTLQAPVVKAQMLIRKPVAQVFEALVDPAITSRFWFSKGSGRLEAGKRVRWDWEMYGASAEVDVKAVEENQRILIEWDGPGNPTSVEWTFEPRGQDGTFVTVKNWGFSGDAEKVVAAALDSTGGFSFLLAGLKVFLEHDIEPSLVEDHAPDALAEGWVSRRGERDSRIGSITSP